MGLMIGGMIFATASSVNTSLNLAAAVLTNDIYKPLNPAASQQSLLRFARISTLAFGVGTILIAFLVPLAGGIVEVVLSIGAVTGGALYGPAIWALFSSRQTGKSILSTTIISLAINLFFKFLAPTILGFSLSRSEEMLVGVGIPFLLLAGFEIFLSKPASGRVAPLEDSSLANDGTEEIQNSYGLKVLAIALVCVGFTFLLLTIWAGTAAKYLISLGLLIVLFGIWLLRAAKVNYSKKTIIQH